jgi:uncharacterized protein YecE (DUF72 family)
MSQLPLFDDAERPPVAARLAPKLRALADQGIFLGTSSWKYEGWLGSVYDESKYTVRGKFSKKRFEDGCLAEYAETFPVVGGDFSFYQFPRASYWERLFLGSKPSLLFGLKVPEEVTVATWPKHDRYGQRAGQGNNSFLDAKLLETAFTRPLRPYRERVAVLMFEFGTFPKRVFPDVSAFLGSLEPFLAALPPDFRYGVEVRNPEYLGPAYFATLRAHNVAHVYNAWTRMPHLDEQVAMPDSETADFSVARALLRRGREYDEAVGQFQPYDEIQEPYPQGREGLIALGERARRRKKPTFLLVNNRLEGFAPGTIEAVADLMAMDD